jgi:hypothetical protein
MAAGIKVSGVLERLSSGCVDLGECLCIGDQSGLRQDVGLCPHKFSFLLAGGNGDLARGKRKRRRGSWVQDMLPSMKSSQSLFLHDWSAIVPFHAWEICKNRYVNLSYHGSPLEL